MSPKTEEQFEKIRQNSAANIKETALELFAKLGYENTSISRIAKEAGISKGLMYNYFESKKALLQDIILEALEVNEKVLEDVLATEETPFEQLKKMLTITVSLVKSNLNHWKLLSALAFQPHILDEFMPIIQSKQQHFMEMGIDLFSRLGVEDPMKESMFFGATLDGMFLHYMSFPEQYPLEEMAVFVLEKYETKQVLNE